MKKFKPIFIHHLLSSEDPCLYCHYIRNSKLTQSLADAVYSSCEFNTDWVQVNFITIGWRLYLPFDLAFLHSLSFESRYLSYLIAYLFLSILI